MKSKKGVKNKEENVVINKVVKPIVKPIQHEFKSKDILQIIIGATILAIPVGFTQEIWLIGKGIPYYISLIFIAISLIFISTFVYYHYHKHKESDQKGHKKAFFKRVISTYIGSFLLVFLLMGLIVTSGLEWTAVTWQEAFKIITIVTLPASMSASIADTIR